LVRREPPARSHKNRENRGRPSQGDDLDRARVRSKATDYSARRQRVANDASGEIYFSREAPVEELAQGIDSIALDQIVELAHAWLELEKMAMELLGDLKGRTYDTSIFSELG
jgi:hypothetical protein